MNDSSKPTENGSPEDAAQKRSIEPTIVGGRPLGRGSPRRRIPRGLEVLVKKASVDPEFRKLLLDKRAEAAADIGLDLSPAETAMLNSIPRAQIEQIIANVTVPDEHRRVFLGKLGAAMLAMLGVALSGCGAPEPPPPLKDQRGARPDDPPPPPKPPTTGIGAGYMPPPPALPPLMSDPDRKYHGPWGGVITPIPAQLRRRNRARPEDE